MGFSLFGSSGSKSQTTNQTTTTTTTNETGDIGLTGEDAVRLAESAQLAGVAASNSLNLVTTTSGQSFSQLLGGASHLIGAGERFIDNASNYGGNILDFSRASSNDAYEFTGNVFDRTENLFSESRDKSIAFADSNISKITSSAIQSSKFVTDTARDIAGSIIPQTKELQQIALAGLALVAVALFITKRK